jgi:hypothetical protein
VRVIIGFVDRLCLTRRSERTWRFDVIDASAGYRS